MKKRLAVIFAVCFTAAPCMAGTILDLNVLGGVKALSSKDWPNRDHQGAVGVEALINPPLLPLSFIAGFLGTAATNDQVTVNPGGGASVTEEVKGQTRELYVGIGEKFNLPLVHFFVGGGPVHIRARYDTASNFSAPATSNSDNGWGYFLTGSTFVQLVGHLNIGAELHYSSAKVTINNNDIRAGGMSYLGFIGFGF